MDWYQSAPLPNIRIGDFPNPAALSRPGARRNTLGKELLKDWYQSQWPKLPTQYHKYVSLIKSKNKCGKTASLLLRWRKLRAGLPLPQGADGAASCKDVDKGSLLVRLLRAWMGIASSSSMLANKPGRRNSWLPPSVKSPKRNGGCLAKTPPPRPAAAATDAVFVFRTDSVHQHHKFCLIV